MIQPGQGYRSEAAHDSALELHVGRRDGSSGCYPTVEGESKLARKPP